MVVSADWSIQLIKIQRFDTWLDKPMVALQASNLSGRYGLSASSYLPRVTFTDGCKNFIIIVGLRNSFLIFSAFILNMCIDVSSWDTRNKHFLSSMGLICRILYVLNNEGKILIDNKTNKVLCSCCNMIKYLWNILCPTMRSRCDSLLYCPNVRYILFLVTWANIEILY